MWFAQGHGELYDTRSVRDGIVYMKKQGCVRVPTDVRNIHSYATRKHEKRPRPVAAPTVQNPLAPVVWEPRERRGGHARDHGVEREQDLLGRRAELVLVEKQGPDERTQLGDLVPGELERQRQSASMNSEPTPSASGVVGGVQR